MNERRDECYFHRDGACGIMMDTLCEGHKNGCTFRKTKQQFIEEKDDAIKVCRRKGLCKNCKYAQNGIICKLSTE